MLLLVCSGLGEGFEAVIDAIEMQTLLRSLDEHTRPSGRRFLIAALKIH